MEFYVFQRFFQRENMNLEFKPEHVMFTLSEFQKIIDNIYNIMDHMKDGLITYTVSHYIYQELEKTCPQLNPVDN